MKMPKSLETTLAIPLTQLYSLTFKSVRMHLSELNSNSTRILYLKQQKTSVHFAQERKVLGNLESLCTLRTAFSIDSSRISCFREVISLMKMELVENRFMEINLMTKISKQRTLREVFFLWPTVDQAQTAASSLLHSRKQNGLMENMSYLVLLRRISVS